jgi:hypothetical protein
MALFNIFGGFSKKFIYNPNYSANRRNRSTTEMATFYQEVHDGKTGQENSRWQDNFGLV